MATKGDDPKKKKEDAKLVSDQKHELRYLAEKFDTTQKVVKEVQDKVGPSRAKVEAELKKKLGK